MFANVLRSQARLALSPCRCSSIFAISRSFAISSYARPALPFKRKHKHWLRRKKIEAPPSYPNESALSNTLYVGRVPHQADESAILELFSKFGIVTDNFLARRWNRSNANYAYVTFKNYEDAVKACEFGRAGLLHLINSELTTGFMTEHTEEPTDTLAIKGFEELDEPTIRAIFADFTIVQAHFVNPSVHSKLAGVVVRFDSVETAEEALKRAIATHGNFFAIYKSRKQRPSSTQYLAYPSRYNTRRR